MQKLLFVYYHLENRTTSQIWKVLPNMVFSPDLGGKNGGVLSMRMQVILDSSFARPGLAPIWGRKKGEFRDWTRNDPDPEMIPTFLLVDPEMIPNELGMAIKHGTVDCSIIRESKAILAYVVN